eukprot:CAMPEP_0176403648 /NCGR_PEP_ID=MMETSP0126-20121128/50271_1 /TAXON_ID=141414 ORGANISM="Strombidinopsis acuminatum, Strain SPMC142" /NCGR_SAMPLE_ID=MMETSP0126 /ASSEMBLY_ACC=CAM_ASM_000229 /LENGTH=67 /DNA_ID=CAMNT_0017782041 /DNA_START=308 /DNA_END=511 /DNA_ORIENTATION=+
MRVHLDAAQIHDPNGGARAVPGRGHLKTNQSDIKEYLNKNLFNNPQARNNKEFVERQNFEVKPNKAL